MVIGTGIDLIQVSRIREAVGRWNDRFLQRIYTPREIQYCQRKRSPTVHFAGRFAAKEAVGKALGETLPWKDVEIGNGRLGEPKVNLTGKAKKLSQGRGVKRILLSLSHDRSYAIAQVILTK
ncbi:holo-ACP synthase [candidate division NPL-UPA2 bacterium]|nr:holo-ACP synthase [candidate division NPL-UPA2 bacterium]